MKNVTDCTNSELLEELQNRGYIRSIWHEDDISGRMDDRDIKYTEDDVKDIRISMDNSWDASIGVNWDVIDTFIDIHFEE